ncbi:hypothetical protein MF672_014150 [Actinomadura sp. ATCC 31491]|uniref:Uncharacterized protein n=1 Tax=Actinomadura luzonensis TaxID=2805427 RepID=A0ABT0FSR1_9ACTN|nr:hypothetical protein [Actinomadura luzonensis]MCK2214918.1 hypothetical protein [Actinomadura luzonensis]
MAEPPFGFTVRVPDTWYAFDVLRAGRTGDLARLVDARVAAAPELAPHRPLLLKVLREVADLAARRGAVFCAAMTDHGAGGAVLATLMALRTPGPQDPAGATPEAIAAGLAGRGAELVELDAGRAVRVADVRTGGAGEPGAVTMQTLVPVPGGHGVLDLVLTSPHPELAEPLLDLFDAISATLAWSDPVSAAKE